MNYATLFDDEYLPKGLAMIRSLLEYHRGAKVYVLNCGSTLVEHAMRLMPPGVSMLSDKSIREFSALREKHSPGPTYYWAAASIWASFVQNMMQDAVTYIDSDLFFFKNTSEIDLEMEGADIGIVPHRWTPKHAQRLRVNGTYNVGWVKFLYTENARQCLAHWAQQCYDWCENRAMPDGRFADQGYLNDWPEDWNAHAVEHLGANLAPWNQEQYDYYRDDRGLHISKSQSAAPSYPLLFYHFHEFKHVAGRRFHLTNYPVSEIVKQHVYKPYIAAYVEAVQDVNSL